MDALCQERQGWFCLLRICDVLNFNNSDMFDPKALKQAPTYGCEWIWYSSHLIDGIKATSSLFRWDQRLQIYFILRKKLGANVVTKVAAGARVLLCLDWI